MHYRLAMGWKTASLLNLILIILLYFYMISPQNALDDRRKKYMISPQNALDDRRKKLYIKNCTLLSQGKLSIKEHSTQCLVS
jgi:hypothetical protein